MHSEEATNTNFIVFGLTRPGLEPTIYRTRGERTNHYATNEVTNYMQFTLTSTNILYKAFQIFELVKHCSLIGQYTFSIFL